jgi:V8-like Glu-specific endopeptidase
MKTKTLVFLTGLFLFCKIVLGQVSQGGIPYSFFSNIKSTSTSKTSLSSDIPVVEMPLVKQSTIDELKEYNNREQDSYQFAIGFEVNIDVKKASVVDSIDCGLLYRLQIKSDKAYSINLIFKDYKIPPGAKLFVYSEDEEDLLGAFTSNNNKASRKFPIFPVKGDNIIVEYFEPYFTDFKGSVVIGRVSHDFLDVLNTSEIEDDFGSSGNCEVDINCAEGNNWQTEKRAVCRILYQGDSWCTGTLLNNTNQDGTPYFLTANHCIDTQDEADECVFIFNYESPSCGGGDGSTSQTISGATLRATGFDSDFTLLELSRTPLSTFRPYYAGWDRNDVQGAGGVCIHHPAGDVKKISTYNIVPPNSNCFTDRPNANFYRINWIATANGHGVTEGGSSGSAIFNSQRRVIGQLYGAAWCTNANCGNPAADISNYGKIFSSWNLGNNASARLRDWLDPNNNTFVLDGINGCSEGTAINLNIQNTITTGTNVTFSATNNIEASNTIQSGANVVYEAGNQITLLPGFNAELGSEFEARIRDLNCVVTCDPINLIAWTSIACTGSGLCFNITNATNYNVTIYSISGSLVHNGSGNISGNSVCVWNASGVATGIYIATVRFSSDCEEISNTYQVLVTSCTKSATLKSSTDTLNNIDSKQMLELEENRSQKLDLQIYPNPSEGIFTLKVTSNNYKPYTVEIYNNNGSVISKIEYANTIELNLNKTDLVSGIYYVKVTMGNNYIVKKLVIK